MSTSLSILISIQKNASSSMTFHKISKVPKFVRKQKQEKLKNAGMDGIVFTGNIDEVKKQIEF